MDTRRSGLILFPSAPSSGGRRTYSGYPDFLRSDYTLLDIVKDGQGVMLRIRSQCRVAEYTYLYVEVGDGLNLHCESRNDHVDGQHDSTSILLFRHQNKSTEDRIARP